MTGIVTASMIPSIIDGIGHAGDAAGLADVGRDALERHDGDGAGILGDLGLIGGDDVHDDAALEHLGEALLGRPGGRFDGHVEGIPLVARARIAGRAGPGVVARSSRPSPSRARIIAPSATGASGPPVTRAADDGPRAAL